MFLKRVVREYKMLIEKMGSKIQDVYEDRRAMRIRIPIHPAFLEADDEVSLPDSYEKATKKSSKKKIEQYEKILKLLNDGEWHKTAEIADNLGLKDTRTKELLKELISETVYVISVKSALFKEMSQSVMRLASSSRVDLISSCMVCTSERCQKA